MEVLIVAGEASADLHARSLVREWKRLRPDIRFFGVGGPALRAEGLEVVARAEQLSAVGVADWMDRLSEVLGAYRAVRGEARKRRPAMAVLLDLPDFNLRLCKQLKKMGVPVLYYISPQVWAWRRYRLRTLRKYVDQLLVVLPFEQTFYERHGVRAEFVGHPLLDQVAARGPLRESEAVTQSPRIALLPGSRKSELAHHGPLLDGLAKRLLAHHPRAELRLPVAPTLAESLVRQHVVCPQVQLVSEPAPSVLAWADLAVVASGTATLEAALVGTPFCLLYRMSPSTQFAIRHLIRYRGFFGLPNLLLGREVVRECTHERATVEALFDECTRLLENPPLREQQAAALAQCRERLGTKGASARAAKKANDLLEHALHQEATLVPSPA